MTAADANWKKLVMMISQQHDVAKHKDTIRDSFNTYPASRPAILDIFSDIIVEKYLAGFVHGRSMHTTELEDTINMLLNEINVILDYEFNNCEYVRIATSSKPFYYSGHGFVNYVTQWLMIMFAKISAKYEAILGIGVGDSGVLQTDRIKWFQVPVIMNLIEILCKTLKSKMVGHEVVSIIMKHVSQNRSHLIWVIKHIGERYHSGIVDKIIECILSEFMPLQEYGKLQSCMLVLSHLGAQHSRQLQSAIYSKLKQAVQESTGVVTPQKMVNYQTLIYFTLLLASRSDGFELTNASISMLGKIIQQFSPKQLEQFFLQQNFGESNLRSYYHMTLNILLTSLDIEIGRLLEFLVHHSHCTTAGRTSIVCCTPQFSHMCISVVSTVCARLLIQSHASRGARSISGSSGKPMSLAVLNSVLQKTDFWIQRVTKEGDTLAAKLLMSIVMNDFRSVAEDLLVAILLNEPNNPSELAAHRKSMVMFFHLLDECELVNPTIISDVVIRVLCTTQTLPIHRQLPVMRTILSMLRHEQQHHSNNHHGNRLARAISADIDLLLGVAVAGRRSVVKAQLTVAILQSIDRPDDEMFSVPSGYAFRPSSITVRPGHRYLSRPLFVSARICRCLGILLTDLLSASANDGDHRGITPTIRKLLDIIINFLRFTDARHTAVAVQILLRQFMHSLKADTNNRVTFKKFLKPGWFHVPLLHDCPPMDTNTGRLCLPEKTALQQPNSHDPGLIWLLLIETLCIHQRQLSSSPGMTTACQALHWTLRQSLCPVYHLFIGQDVAKDLSPVSLLWKRFNQSSIFRTLLSLLARQEPACLKAPFQTMEALILACQHLWSTSDCPRRRLLRASTACDIFEINTTSNSIQAWPVGKKKRFYEVIDGSSATARSTAHLLECIGYVIPLSEELKLLLPYFSPTEVQTVMTHLGCSWLKVARMPLGDPNADRDPKNTFSWETLLPALVHARIHFSSLYEQFCRVLSVPYI